MAEDRYTLIWLPAARRDLHCLDCGPRRLDELMAATLAAAIVERAQILISFPEIGRPMRQFGENWRQLLQRPYRIIHYLDRTTRTIYVARIWHSARAEPTEDDLQ